jgi:enoyl-CoA hydratase/carnithine racemase
VDAILSRVDPRGVAHLTLNRPERLNSFTAADYAELAHALERCHENDACRVVVLTGAGRAFSVGADRSLLERTDERATSEAGDAFYGLLDVLMSFDKPLIAAVNGLAIGFGCTVLLYADLVVAASSARLRLPFTTLGLVPEAGSSALLATRMRAADATWALLTSDWIDGDAAVRSGLVWRLVPDEDLAEEVSALAVSIAAHDPASVTATKRLLTSGRADLARAAIERERAAMAQIFGTT